MKLSECFIRILFFALSSAIIISCNNKSTPQNISEQKETAQTIIDTCRSIETIQAAAGRFKSERNVYGQMLALKKLGKSYRNQADFSDAIKAHEEQYRLAVQLKDTAEMIQALNELGTNFRRIGVLEEASNYHYRALTLAEKTEDSTFTSQKNKVISLNGLGNVFLTLENYTAAEAAFRRAMNGEQKLKSELGVAINCANIGAIFEKRKQYDSAYYYYNQSLQHNRAAESDLGISLCYGYIGSLYEKHGNYQMARKNYEEAYRIMEKESDSWHRLESCIDLARVSLAEKKYKEALECLTTARQTAEKIHSKEHLAEIYELFCKLYKAQGNYNMALECMTKGHEYSDSVKNAKSVMAINNLRVNYEREKGERNVLIAQSDLTAERQAKHIILVGSIIIVILLTASLVMLLYLLRMRILAQRAMQRVESMRSSFFTNVTHEFRTPLTVILGIAEQLHSAFSNDKELTKPLETLEKQGKVLLTLVNQLLDMAKVMSKEYAPQWCNGDVTMFLRMAVEVYKPYAAQKGIHIVISSKETETIIDFIPEYWEKILRNLLSNALKYTPENGEITISLIPQGKDVIWTVRDTGKGISPTDLPHLFDEFYRGADSRFFAGSGIGLAFVRQMVNDMKGDISADNHPDGGAVFTIRLPRHCKNNSVIPYEIEDYETSGKEQKLEISTANAQDCNIAAEPEKGMPILLIVEDNEDIANYMAGILKKKYRVAYASNGQEGLDKAISILPDLIITDLMMPEMGGYEMSEKIRNTELTNHIPIIAVTAKCEESDRLEGWKKGIDAYITKPFNTEELIVCVEKLLQKQALLRDKYSKVLLQSDNADTGEKIQPMNRHFLSQLDSIIKKQISERTLSSEILADRMCLSRSQLNRKVKAITGYNTAAYILLIRMNYAGHLLASTELTVGEIADKCSFEDQSHFARCFKQRYGCSPTQYRNISIKHL